MIADNFLQQILLRPQDYSVVATLNLNGDFMSDALAAQVGVLVLPQALICLIVSLCLKRLMVQLPNTQA